MAASKIEDKKKELAAILKNMPQTKAYYISRENPQRWTALRGKALNWAGGFEEVRNPDYDPQRKVSAFQDEAIKVETIEPETEKVKAGENVINPESNPQK